MTIEKAAELFLEEEQLATGQCYKIVPNQLFNKFFSWLEEKGIEVQTRQLKKKSNKKQIEHFSITMPTKTPIIEE